MKYWEIIADNLHKAGWSLGWVSALDLKRRGAHGYGTGDSPVCGEFIVATLLPLSEIAVVLAGA